MADEMQSGTPIFYRTNSGYTAAGAAAAQETGPHALASSATATSKYNRFEQLLKNLVGRKVSREMPTIASSAIIGSNASVLNGNSSSSSSSTSNSSSSCISSYSSSNEAARAVTTIQTRQQQPINNGSTKRIDHNSANDIRVNASRRYSGDDALSCASRCDEFVDQQLDQPLLPPSSILSPEIKISRTPSAHNLLFRNDKCLTSTSSASTTSLNAAVHQRLWSVVPLLRREGSCASLNQQNTVKPLIHQQQQQHQPRSDARLKKCETVSALTHSQTTTSFEPIKPRNRLRQSPSVATCSRCSSILSLAANGSRYSLNIANGGFVSIKSNLGEFWAFSFGKNSNFNHSYFCSPILLQCRKIHIDSEWCKQSGSNIIDTIIADIVECIVIGTNSLQIVPGRCQNGQSGENPSV